MSVENFNDLYFSQDGKCSICKRELANRFLDKGGLQPYVDHSHTSGKVRNLLCMKCNTGLGSFEDNVLYLDKAKEYLEKHRI